MSSSLLPQKTATWVRVATIDQFPRSGILTVNFAGNSLILHRQGTNIVCYRNACSHLASPLDSGKVENGILTCPVHGFEYRLATGECLTAPDMSLVSYPLQVRVSS